MTYPYSLSPTNTIGMGPAMSTWTHNTCSPVLSLLASSPPPHFIDIPVLPPPTPLSSVHHPHGELDLDNRVQPPDCLFWPACPRPLASSHQPFSSSLICNKIISIIIEFFVLLNFNICGFSNGWPNAASNPTAVMPSAIFQHLYR